MLQFKLDAQFHMIVGEIFGQEGFSYQRQVICLLFIIRNDVNGARNEIGDLCLISFRLISVAQNILT